MALELSPPAARGIWADVLEDIVLPARRNATWNNYYDDLVALIKWKIKGQHAFARVERPGARTAAGALRVVEIGTMYGGASERMLQRLPGIELFVVDPFLGGFSGETKEAGRHGGTAIASNLYPTLRGWGLDSSSLSRAWAQGMAHDFRSRFGCRVHVIHNFSLAVAPALADESVDVAFVDGLHTYDAVAADLHAWWPKLASDGGVMILNDYGTRNHPDVAKAAGAFFGRLSKRICVGAKGRPPGHRNAWVLKGAEQCHL